MNGTVINLMRKSESAEYPTYDDMIYRKGKMSASCTLILNGNLTVLVGKDAFKAEIGLILECNFCLS